MSEELVPTGDAGYGETQLQAWQEPRQAPPPPSRSPIERPLAAVRRYKWLILAIFIVSSVGGVFATRFVKPTYEVHASIMLSGGSPMDAAAGPIRPGGLLAADDWIQLLKSFVIADAVVRKLTLYLKPANPADSVLFRGFGLADQYIPSEYELLIDRGRKRWTLTHVKTGYARDSGAVADSIGKSVGFLWLLPKTAWNGGGQKKVDFTVTTPREQALSLTRRLDAQRPEQLSNFLLVSFNDPNGQLGARIINTWLAEYVSVAADLKKHKLVGFATTLEAQLHSAKSALDEAEVGLSQFRVKTIREPGEGAPISAGLAMTQDPAIAGFFARQTAYDNERHDIAALDNILRKVAKDSVSADLMLQVPSVETGGTPARSLLSAFEELQKKENDLAAARVGYQEEHPVIKLLVADVANLKRVKIPSLANQLLLTLRERARDDSARVEALGANLERIPVKAIEEERLRRQQTLNAGLFANLQGRFAEAQLAEASAGPDLTVVDTAIAPLDPIKNNTNIIILGGVFGGLGAALALAILLDQLDGRLRYPEQASSELGLPIAGTVPRIPKGGVDERSPEQMFQLVESFRSLRMSVSHAVGPTVSLAISSPSPGEGKSLISANLAMSFADAGLRTVLVDGDTRRGTLHEMFSLTLSPGLTDYLSGRASTRDVVRPTDNDNLTVIPCGIRQRRSPELLTSPRLATLVAELKESYDVVIFDTPPLAAGVDGYSIAAAAGSLLVVLRVGETERRMAAAKLRMFERLPVDIIGTVLNGIEFQGEYEYYGYVGGYEAQDEPGTSVAPVP